jgi:hypothetical protein
VGHLRCLRNCNQHYTVCLRCLALNPRQISWEYFPRTKMVAPLLLIRVKISDLTAYSIWGFHQFPLPLGKCQESIQIWATTTSFHTFQISIQSSPYLSTTPLLCYWQRRYIYHEYIKDSVEEGSKRFPPWSANDDPFRPIFHTWPPKIHFRLLFNKMHATNP